MTFIKNVAFIVIFLSCVCNICASEKVNNIKVIGNQKILKDTILFYSDLKLGDDITKDNIDKSIKGLYKTGFFSNISIKRKQRNTIVIEVQESPVIRKITIKGSKKIKGDNIKSDLLSKQGNVYSKFQIESDVKRITVLYKKMGYHSANVEYSVKETGKNSVDISIIIHEGTKPTIKKITFLDNKKYSQRDLLKIIASKEAVWYRFFSSSDLYDQDRILLDKELLRDHYMQKGYADFKVISSASEITPNGESFLINYLIHEGDKFNFGNTIINCQIKDAKNLDLNKFTQYKKGELFNERLIEETADTIKKHIRDIGYTFANVEYQLNKDQKHKIVDVTFIVHETSKYFIRNINITGNTRTLDRVIRREFRIYEGDPYNLSKIQRSKQRVANLGYFSSVEFENKPTSEPDKIDLDVKVKEVSTGALRFAIGYNTAVGAIGSTSLSEYNFLGKGQIVELDFSKAKKSSDISFGFTEPRFMDRNLELGFDIFATSQDMTSESSYSVKNKGITLRMGYGINEYLYHNVHYSIKHEKSTKDNSASLFLKAQPGKTLVSSVGHSITYDKLDSRIKPTKGYLLRLSQNVAGLGGDVKYLQHQLYTSYYRPLYKDDIILSLVGRAGNIKGIGSKNVNISDSFFIGEQYIRGFDIAGIGPRVKNKEHPREGDALGGKTFFAGTVEAQFPLGLPEEFDMKGAVFADFATLYDTDAAKYKCKKPDCDCDENTKNKESCKGETLQKDAIHDNKKIRASYGIGIVWNSPIGFIRLDYGIPFKKESFDKLQRVRFSIGTNF